MRRRGILIILCTVAPTLLWGDLANTYVWVAVLAMVLFGLVGLYDDVLKVRRKQSLGLRPAQKIVLQIALAALIGLVFIWMGSRGQFDLRLSFPFFKQWLPTLGWFYLPWIVFILVGSSNAVNLADGLDGLAIGLTLISATALTALTYVAGHALWSQYLNIARVPLAAELTVFVGALAGACPCRASLARVFMGDVGPVAPAAPGRHRPAHQAGVPALRRVASILEASRSSPVILLQSERATHLQMAPSHH
jgi:phospho-N-acetylmuramoyl-pentapeptide-transferase